MNTARIFNGEFNFEVSRGAIVTFAVPFRLKSTKAPIDWTGYEFLCQIRKNTSLSSPLIGEIAVSSGDDPTLGVLRLTIDATDIVPGVYCYDVRATIGEEQPYVLSGGLEITGSVTRPV